MSEVPDPNVLAAELNTKILKRGFIVPFSWEMLAPARPGVTKLHPKSRTWLFKRKVFGKIWNRLVDYGWDRKFLDTEPCYECGGAYVITTHVADSEFIPDKITT